MITRRLRIGALVLGAVMIVVGVLSRDITIGSGGLLLVLTGPTLTFQDPRRPS